MKINSKKIVSPIVVLILWELVSHSNLIEPYFLPPVTKIVKTLYSLIMTGEVFPHVGISLMRGICGYMLAAIIGISLGLLIAWSKLFENIFDPLIELIRPISTFALIPIFFVWFGIGNGSKVAIIFKACFFPIVINTIAGIKGVDAKLIKAAQSLGARGSQVWTKVLIPSALPMIVTGLRISTAITMLAIVGVEMLAADSGIGFLIIDAQRVFATDRMFAGIIIISLLGFSLDRIARAIQQRILSWHVETSLEGGNI